MVCASADSLRASGCSNATPSRASTSAVSLKRSAIRRWYSVERSSTTNTAAGCGFRKPSMVLWSNSGISSEKAHDFAFSDICVFQRRAAGRRCCAPTIKAARSSILAASCFAGLPSIGALGSTASPSLRSSSMAPPASRAGASSSPCRMPRRAKMLQPMLLRGGPSKEKVRSGAPRASASWARSPPVVMARHRAPRIMA